MSMLRTAPVKDTAQPLAVDMVALDNVNKTNLNEVAT